MTRRSSRMMTEMQQGLVSMRQYHKKDNGFKVAVLFSSFSSHFYF